MEEGTGILIIYFVYFVFVKFIVVVVVVDPGTVSDRAEVKFIFYWVCYTRVCTRVPVFSFPDTANCKACEIYLYFNYSWGIFVIYMMPWVLICEMSFCSVLAVCIFDFLNLATSMFHKFIGPFSVMCVCFFRFHSLFTVARLGFEKVVQFRLKELMGFPRNLIPKQFTQQDHGP